MIKGYAAIYIKNPYCSINKSGFQDRKEAEQYIENPEVGGVPLIREDWMIVDIEALIKRLEL